MYDWNHNGKHDAFDDAMFMALYEDDLERHPPKNKKRNRSSDSSGDGCFGLILLISLGIIVGGLFLLGILMTIVDGNVWLLLVLSAILAGVIYVYWKSNIKQISQFTNDAAINRGNGNNMPEMNTTAESEYHYNMTATGIEIIGCVCTDKTESKKKEFKKSVSTSGSAKTASSTKTSSNVYSKNNASTVSGYAAGMAASAILLDDLNSSDDSADWEDHGTARDRLDDDLIGTGYDSYDLEWMDEDERDEILWDNGLDPLDYDFYGLDDMD